MRSDLRIAVKKMRTGLGDLQVKNIAIEAHDYSMLFAQRRHPGGMLVEGPERKVNSYLIYDVTAQKFCQTGEVTNEFKASCEEFVDSRPIIIHKAQ